MCNLPKNTRIIHDGGDALVTVTEATSQADQRLIGRLTQMSRKERIAYLAVLERTGKLKDELTGTSYLLSDGTVAAITLASDLGLIEQIDEKT